MLDNFVLTIAIRYFRAKKNEKLVSVISAFSLLGVMIGVAALIVVISVMNGFHIELSKNIIGLNGDITITSFDKTIDNYISVKEQVQRKAYVRGAGLGIIGQGLALGPRTNTGILIKGIDIEDLKYKESVLRNIINGSFDDFAGNHVIAVGSELAVALGVRAGDKLKIISPNSISTAMGSMPRSKEFNIIAVFSSGMYDYDAATVLMPLAAARNFLSMPGVNVIEVYTIAPAKADIFAFDIQKILDPNLRAISWQKSNLQFFNALAVERVAMFAILSLIILVAAFNIISSLFMLVKDKTRDIAILRTMGASTRQIMLIFICNGMFIGLIGTGLGVTLGTGFACNIDAIKTFLERITGTKIFEAAIYFLYSLPSDVRLGDVLLVTSLSIVLCFCATIYPAYKASKFNPVDALRYE